VQVVDELHEAGVGAVEFVVAEGEGVEAHGVHEHRVGLAFALGEIQVAGDGVARVELEHVGLAGGELFDGGGDAGEAAQIHGDRAAGAGGVLEGQRGGFGIQMRVVVIDVQDAQVEGLALVVAAATTGGEGEGTQGRGKGAQRGRDLHGGHGRGQKWISLQANDLALNPRETSPGAKKPTPDWHRALAFVWLAAL
jgi:hypothetical protein